jgi:hypothetical protein
LSFFDVEHVFGLAFGAPDGVPAVTFSMTNLTRFGNSIPEFVAMCDRLVSCSAIITIRARSSVRPAFLFTSPERGNDPSRCSIDKGPGCGALCWPGGIGIGLRALGFNVAKAYDSWDRAVAIYNHNFPGEVAVVANLLSEKGRKIVVAERRRLGEIELLAAGPPCKGFSQLRNGHHDGRNGHNRVLAAMPDYVALVRPRLFVLENVPDLIRYRAGKTLADLLARLKRPANRLRYRVEYKGQRAESSSECFAGWKDRHSMSLPAWPEGQVTEL